MQAGACKSGRHANHDITPHISNRPSDLAVLLLLQTGQLHTYLAAIPVISSAWGGSLAYCTSLQELAIMDVTRSGGQMHVTIPTEPAFLALGPGHLVAGMNNKVCDTTQRS